MSFKTKTNSISCSSANYFRFTRNRIAGKLEQTKFRCLLCICRRPIHPLSFFSRNKQIRLFKYLRPTGNFERRRRFSSGVFFSLSTRKKENENREYIPTIQRNMTLKMLLSACVFSHPQNTVDDNFFFLCYTFFNYVS